VLVVDDDELVCRAGLRMLRMLGCEPKCCAEAGEAVKRYREAREGGCRFDVVLTDVTLPGAMGGLEVAAAIRRIGPAARILMSSGYTDLPIAIDPAGHGVDGYPRKPYTLEHLRAAFALVLHDRAA
jgi:two-component system cell cycle sensor histidine kinase/response regulator CckA